MLRNLGIALCLLTSTVIAGDQLSEKWARRLESADGTYRTAVAKAENARFYAIQKANGDRLKVLKQALTDATKSGDFDAATAIKERIAATEQAGIMRTKPKNLVRSGGHEYALIEDKATWHVAKRICEEMGGHLATVESPSENETLLNMCREAKSEPWIGATDEEHEGEWKWVTSAPFQIKIHQDNANDIQHYLLFHTGLGTWDDGDGGARHSFICQWDK